MGYIYHFNIGDLENAEKYYKIALNIDPANAPVCQALGVLYIQRGDHENAHLMLARAKELGYSDRSEWGEYGEATPHFTPGPYSIGGLPMLFAVTKSYVDEFLESKNEVSDKINSSADTNST